MLKRDEIHFFNEIGYYHVPFTHCPTGEQTRLDLKCHCNPNDNFDWKGYSCKFRVAMLRFVPRLTFLGTARFFEMNNMDKPAGYEDEQE